MDDKRAWLSRVAAAGYTIEKRFNDYVVLDPKDRALRRFKRRYEAEAFMGKRIGVERRGFGHAVYRALAHDGTVLYVGVTSSLWSRMAAHRSGSPWWPVAAWIDWAVYSSRDEAERVERATIRRYRPRCNIQGLAS